MNDQIHGFMKRSVKPITVASDCMTANRRYVKGRKMRKALHLDVGQVMTDFKVEQRIAESIVGSKTKSLQMDLTAEEGKCIVTDPLDNQHAVVDADLRGDCGK